MKKVFSLCGEWELYYSENQYSIPTETELLCPNKISVHVPENFEISLARAGAIDADLYKGMNTVINQKFEDCDWWYKKKLDIPKINLGEHIFLNFDGVDCIAEYFINGQKVYESDNALIAHRFEITDFVKLGEKNTLHVHIKSATKYAYEQEYNQYLALSCRMGYQAYLRKPAHAYGWDIFPRAVSGGIWRDVSLEVCDEYSISDFSYYVKSIGINNANIVFAAVIEAPYKELKRNVEIRIKAKCGEHEFTHIQKVNHCRICKFSIWVGDPKLWWPYGYGDANVYDLTYELLIDGEVKDTNCMNMGIRTATLVRTDTMLEDGHCFKFVVNGIDVMCRGSNWVPLDAYHSRDKEKYQKALELFTDTHCNIVRVWGGGVYEQHEFYDYCDRHGIMVWQDFCMACCAVPFEGKNAQNIEKEATWVVKTLRNHPSIVLWSGDNEIDEMLYYTDKFSGINKITREVLPKVIELNDTKRSYLPSSPYLDDTTLKKYGYGGDEKFDIYPERHLWGARDYYKAKYYSQSKAHFVSEMGYHGCPSVESVNKIVDEDSVWGIYNEQWSLHSSDQNGSMARVKLMEDQILQLFGFKPENIEDFSIASQISQAEAKKFFIEHMRVRKPYTSGIIWWNMLDGWPQMSDAVVDYFFDKKLAYDYIKRSQQPFAIMIDEMSDWNYKLIASNDTLEEKHGTYKVYDVVTKDILKHGNFTVGTNQNLNLGGIRMMYSDKKFLVIEWEMDGIIYYNHYLCGYPAFDFETYKAWLAEYRRICGE